MPVQKQSNALDCGVFAIANAFELLKSDDVPSMVWYDEKKMREHLVKCLECQTILPFPKIESSINVSRKSTAI